MKPYSKLSSKNLGLLLLISRAFTFISIVLIVFCIIAIAYGFILQSGFNINIWYVTGVAILPYALSVLFCSGVMAAIVAFEESYRQKSEAFISTKLNI